MSEISDLFARDPLSLSDTDLDKIIAHYRENRASYVAGIKVAKVKPTKSATGTLNLEDLDL